AVPQRAHGPVPPGQDLHQARHQLTRPAGPGPAPRPGHYPPALAPASRRAAGPRLATLAGHWRMRTPAGANETWRAAGTVSTPQVSPGSGRSAGCPSACPCTDEGKRIVAMNWPEKETVADQSQGVPLAMIQELARYWATEYDSHKVGGRLNALPQFITEIDGLDIHFI